MSIAYTGVVEAINTKDVKTKYGMKPVFEAVIDGQTFKFGFKKPIVSVGDSVSLNYDPSKYGNDVVDYSKIAGAGKLGAPTPPTPAPRNFASKGVFPIPGDDGQRSIVRQNALTNARELFTAYAIPASPLTVEDMKSHAEAVIEVARVFEGYTSGTADEEAIRKEFDNG